jgi:hypothetical protein
MAVADPLQAPFAARRDDPLDDPGRRSLELARVAAARRDRRDPQPVEELVEERGGHAAGLYGGADRAARTEG